MIATAGSWKFRLALLIAAALGTFLCVVHPEPFPTDGDEAFQAMRIRETPEALRAALLADAVHPPLDYVVDRIWERVFPGSSRRRIEPTVWGFLGVIAFGALLAARAGRFAGVAGALLFAAALYRLSETRRLRPYPLAIFLMLGSLLLLDAWMRRPSVPRIAGAFLLAVGASWTLFLAAPVLAVAALALVLEDRSSEDPGRRRAAGRLLRLWPVFLAGALAAVAPLFPLLRAASSVHVEIAAPPLSAIRLARVFSYATVSPNAGYSFPPRALFLAALLAGCALIAAGTAAAIRIPGCRFFVAWAFGGIAIVEAVKHFHPHFDSFRYYVPAALALTALEAIALDRLRRRAGKAVAAAALALVLLSLVPAQIRYYRYGTWYFSSGAGRPGKPPRNPMFGSRP